VVHFVNVCPVSDRARIGGLVFGNAAELDWLEQLLHPKVVQDHAAWMEQLASSSDPPRVAVTEVPLLFETGAEKRFDVVVVITAPPGVRAERRPVVDAREQRLVPEEEKLRLADYF